MKKYKCFLLFVICNITVWADFFHNQPFNPVVLPVAIDTTAINQYDEIGLRTGLWKDDIYNYVVFANYKEGRLDGARVVYTNGDIPDKLYYLSEVSFYNMGLLQGSVYMFLPNGRIGVCIVNIINNPSSESFPYKGYTYEYNDDGTLAREGYYLFSEDFEIENKHVGIWKIYDADGSYSEKDYGN